VDKVDLVDGVDLVGNPARAVVGTTRGYVGRGGHLRRVRGEWSRRMLYLRKSAFTWGYSL